MIRKIWEKRPRKTGLLRRLLAVLLCLNMLAGVVSSTLIPTVQAQGEESRAETKARLMNQIRYENWDPYSEDMSLDEFYALMELFDEGALPLETSNISTYSAISLLSDEPEEPVLPTIPRKMFMFSGLPETGIPEVDKPLEYKNTDNHEPIEGTDPEEFDYPAGLDPYGLGYKRPPMSWEGLFSEGPKILIVKEGQNSANKSIAGDVDQSLFKNYQDNYGYYVRRVTAENTEVTVLGAIKLSGQDKVVYYYLTDEKQESDVSTTALPDGKKFIIEYSPVEHIVEYEVRMNSTDGRDGEVITNRTPEETFGDTVNVLGTDMPDVSWENIIFGANHPGKTDGGAYSFNAYAPYGYRVEFYLDKNDGLGPVLQMGDSRPGDFDTVNDGWALGKEPDYKNGSDSNSTILPNTAKGPAILTVSGTFHNDNVQHNRKIIAVVHKNENPSFLVAPIYKDINHVSGRGTSATTEVTTADGKKVPYDYEDVYLFFKGAESKYSYTTGGLGSSASEGNLKAGNVATNDAWNWTKGDLHPFKDGAMEMTQAADGTWSYQWTWQSNSDSGGFTLDALAVNGIGITIPFYSKYEEGQTTPATHSRWYTRTILPDGATLLVEHLMTFGNQHVYRFTVTGARTNVVVSSMNLMQGSGAPEFVAYQLDGVTGATSKGNNNHTEGMQYHNGSTWASGMDELGNTYEGEILVEKQAGSISWSGDTSKHGANIRFKLADGYDSPVYLWEATRDGVIKDAANRPQASIDRYADGSLNYGTMRGVQSLANLEDEDLIDPQYIYKGDDGWYYIRVSEHESQYKIALLTIVAREVRYVVRYVPTSDEVSNPRNMPSYDHTGEHVSFEFPTSWQYDTANGAYYDASVDSVIRLSNATPTDPASQYRFVDWVLVDENYKPIWAWTNESGDSVQVTTDQYGNRILVTQSTANDTVHHPALLVNGILEVGTDYEIYWTGSYYDLKSRTTGVDSTPENWVLLTKDGKLAYAKDGSLVDADDVTDLDTQLKDWCVRDANGDAATISATSTFRYRSNYITLLDVNQYAIANDTLGGVSTDIYVLRLMPTWELITNPFHYNVALNWVDAQGGVHTDFFSRNWNEVLTDWRIDDDNYLTVQVIRDAQPIRDWIANNPTYDFWDEVNNNNALYRNRNDSDGGRGAMEAEMKKAIEEYLPDLKPGDDPDDPNDPYYKVLGALCNRDIAGKDGNGDPVTDNNGNDVDDFWRLGEYAFQVREDYGTIVVWMYENKGGLTFRKEVKGDSFIPNDEFYFTVSNVVVSNSITSELLKGTYKAYPETVYDDRGVKRDRLDSDAWLVTFVDGAVTSIVKNDGSADSHNPDTFFTLLSGEGIELYVPAGEYTITELGSKSGGAYRVQVEYDGNSTPSLNSNWSLPEGNLWLKGKSNRYYPSGAMPDDVSQVSATVNFEIGEKNVVHTLQFNNKTASLSIEKALSATEANQKEFDAWLASGDNSDRLYHFEVTLELPAGYTPLKEWDTDSEDNPVGDPYYYFTMNVYYKNGSFSATKKLVLTKGEGNSWTGKIDLMGGQRAVIVMTAPEDEQTLYYEYTETDNGVVKEGKITDSANIIDVMGTPLYYNPDIDDNCSIFYYVGDRKVYVTSWNQIQLLKRTGNLHLAHKNGDALYYLAGKLENGGKYDFYELPQSPYGVKLHMATVDGNYQVCEEKVVPLYVGNGSDYQLIKDLSELNDAVKVGIYYRFENDYYPVTLVENENADSGYPYENVSVGTYGEEIAVTLKKEFAIFSSPNGGSFLGVESLEDISLQADTTMIPVSKAVFNYWFADEIWNKSDGWKANEWDDATGKTTIFIEQWSKQSGVAEAGENTDAKVVNWYKQLPDYGYLAITETGGNSDDTFLYRITSADGTELIVSVKGGGVTYVYAPVGEYTIEEITDWAWKYEDGVCEQATADPKSKATVTITSDNDTPANAMHADYNNEYNDKTWLGGGIRKDNLFVSLPEEGEEQETVSLKREDAVAVSVDGKKKHTSVDE